jgi:hypothetical protein
MKYTIHDADLGIDIAQLDSPAEVSAFRAAYGQGAKALTVTRLTPSST